MVSNIKYVVGFLLLSGILYGTPHHPQQWLDTIKGTPNEGTQIVTHYCINCHGTKPLIPLGAPRIGNKDDWALRLKQNAALFFKHTDEGWHAMPARGGCFECTNEQLVLAIIYMLPKNAQKEWINILSAYKKNTQ